jgi:hypothetical protein
MSVRTRILEVNNPLIIALRQLYTAARIFEYLHS